MTSKEKRLNSYELAELTGLQTIVITRAARKIPGAVRVNRHWEFPESSVDWVRKRIRSKLYIKKGAEK